MLVIAKPPEALPYPVCTGVDGVNKLRLYIIISEIEPIFTCTPPLKKAVDVNSARPPLLIIVVAVGGTLVYLDAVVC